MSRDGRVGCLSLLRAGFLGVATLLFPRERLDAMVKALAVSVGPEEWNDVLERMPELRS